MKSQEKINESELFAFLRFLKQPDITNIEIGEFQKVIDRYKKTKKNQQVCKMMEAIFNAGFPEAAKSVFFEFYNLDGNNPEPFNDNFEFLEFFSEILATEHEKNERGF